MVVRVRTSVIACRRLGSHADLILTARCVHHQRRADLRLTALLDRDGVLRAFGALDEELQRRGTRADVFVAGGTAMAVAYDARRATADVDAVFVPTSEVCSAARRVAERLGLDDDWLNDGAKAFVLGTDPDRREVFEGQYLHVAATSPRFLLAMKLLAARVERDQDDIRTLYRLCGFTTAGEGLRLMQSTYPEHLLAPRTRFMVEEMFPPRQVGHDRGREGPGLGI